MTLDFACCGCQDSVGVTLQVKGAGLRLNDEPMAAVQVPCPSCGVFNHVFFNADSGTVWTVQLVSPLRLLPKPSNN